MILRWTSRAAVLGLTGVAAIGAVVPGLPTVPFLLLAAALSRRAWPSFARRMETHPRYAESLRAWREDGAVPRGAKRCAAVAMVASWLAAFGAGLAPWFLAAMALVMAGALGWLWTRPDVTRGDGHGTSGLAFRG